jgi:hypothetical protein
MDPQDKKHYPRFENYNNFWLVKTPGIKKNIFPGVARPYYRVYHLANQMLL